MTRDDILRMATEAGLNSYRIAPGEAVAVWGRFAALVAAAEREECAKVAKAISNKYAFGHYGNEVDTADEIADAIRARGKT